jgi:hypothetical protein
MWVKKSCEQFSARCPEKTTQKDLEIFRMPWMAANPSQSSSSFGDCPAPQGAGISFEN